MSKNTARIAAALFCGTLFGAGLGVSGLANPERVLQFLTIDANWSPALLFTMGAAVVVAGIGYRLVLRGGPVFAEKLQLPTRTDLDGRLLGGAAIFGLGWGIAGFCPGPAVTDLSSGHMEPVVFVLAMLVGAWLQRWRGRQAA